jgi:hypothetical protein
MFWMDDAEDWRAVVEEFKGEDLEAVPEVVADLDALMHAHLDEQELEAVLMELGCGVNRDGELGSWLAFDIHKSV